MTTTTTCPTWCTEQHEPYTEDDLITANAQSHSRPLAVAVGVVRHDGHISTTHDVTLELEVFDVMEGEYGNSRPVGTGWPWITFRANDGDLIELDGPMACRQLSAALLVAANAAEAAMDAELRSS